MFYMLKLDRTLDVPPKFFGKDLHTTLRTRVYEEVGRLAAGARNRCHGKDGVGLCSGSGGRWGVSRAAVVCYPGQPRVWPAGRWAGMGRGPAQ